MPLDESFTGQNAVLSVGENEYPITNIEYTIQAETSEIRQQTSYNSITAVGGVSISGSFEYQGKNDDWIDSLWSIGAGNQIRGPNRVFISIEELQPNREINPDPDPAVTPQELENRTVLLKNVVITRIDRELPADEVTTTRMDFTAETADVLST